MLKLFNFKWDMRTLCNILKFPFIITIRPLFFLFFIMVDFAHHNMDYWDEYIPAWKSR